MRKAICSPTSSEFTGQNGGDDEPELKLFPTVPLDDKKTVEIAQQIRDEFVKKRFLKPLLAPVGSVLGVIFVTLGVLGAVFGAPWRPKAPPRTEKRAKK